MDKQEIDRLLKTPSDMRSCKLADLSDKVAQFNQKAIKHTAGQAANPFSQTSGVSGLTKPTLDKNDPNYGRPVAGSKTDMRGRKAHGHIGKEVTELCQVIQEFGEPIEELTEDGQHQVMISFGELFQIYTAISNKVVGLLLRARKYDLVHFEGEMLFQRRDDNVPIILLKSLDEINAHQVIGEDY